MGYYFEVLRVLGLLGVFIIGFSKGGWGGDFWVVFFLKIIFLRCGGLSVFFGKYI